MTRHQILRFFALIACAVALPVQIAHAHGSLRKATQAETAHLRNVEAALKKAFSRQAGSLKLYEASDDTHSAQQMDSRRAVDKGLYSQWLSFEYGKSVDDIRAQSGLESKLAQAAEQGNAAKEQALREQLAQLAAAQRCLIEVGVNHGVLDFTYEKGKVDTVPVAGAVAYRSAYATDTTSSLPYLTGTFIGLGPFGGAKNTPYDGNPGGTFEVQAAENKGAPAFSVQNILIRIYAAPAVADQVIKQIDLNALRALLGKKV
ncbi:MAG TPA: hypothetical protein VIT92_00300 [Burkholderiaceae bacterium]